jgi:methoxymalonate biosynthesis acyl carrier protein
MNTTATNTESRAKIRAFILSSINLPDLADDDNLFESGIVNSLFAVELMTFLEKTFAIEVSPDDLDIANFQSIDACADFVARKSAA